MSKKLLPLILPPLLAVLTLPVESVELNRVTGEVLLPQRNLVSDSQTVDSLDCFGGRENEILYSEAPNLPIAECCGSGTTGGRALPALDIHLERDTALCRVSGAPDKPSPDYTNKTSTDCVFSRPISSEEYLISAALQTQTNTAQPKKPPKWFRTLRHWCVQIGPILGVTVSVISLLLLFIL